MGYDAFNIIELLLKEKSTDLVKKLHEIKFKGVTGQISLDKSTKTIKHLSLIKIREGGRIMELH